MSRIVRISSFLIFITASFSLFAATHDLPVVTASAALDHMRFTSTPSVAAIRVEVATTAGASLFDSGWRGGDVFDWALSDRDGHKLAGGSYSVTVSVRDLDGRVMLKRATVTVASDQVAVESATGDEAMVITVPPDLMKVTIVAHDGESGTVASTSGDLTFRTGDFFTGKDTEQMRVTSEGKVGIGTDHPSERLDVHGMIKADGFVLSDGTVVSTTSDQNVTTRTATRPAGAIPVIGVGNQALGAEATAKTFGLKPVTNVVLAPALTIGMGGAGPRIIAVDRNPIAGAPGSALTMTAGSPLPGSTDLKGGDLLLQPGVGTGLGGGGDLHLQTAGANLLSGTTDNVTIDREIVVARAKQLTLAAPGFTSLMSIHLTGTQTAGGRIFYMVRATDGGSQIATEEGVIQYLATANSITCTVQTTDKLHLGTVNSGCTPGFFNPGSQPGVSIFDNVTFSAPAPLVVHEIYFRITNDSGSSIRLEP